MGCQRSIGVDFNVDATVMMGLEDDSVMMLGC